MKKIYALGIILSFLAELVAMGQDSVTDFDGNIYHTVVIGNQLWLRENLKSLHYADGTQVPDAVSYNNSDSLASIYGLLYTWQAAMKNSTAAGSQGVCPEGCHLPSHDEWTELETFLGGFEIAGGKMKETGTGHWNTPNTGATNSSGFTALPGGEYDAHQFMKFNLLKEYAVFWTSTEVNGSLAKERYLSYDNAQCLPYNWYKNMKYSIRCIKDNTVGINSPKENQGKIILSNPFDATLTVRGSDSYPFHVRVIDLSGRIMINRVFPGKTNTVSINTTGLPVGLYLIEVRTRQNNPGKITGQEEQQIVFKALRKE